MGEFDFDFPDFNLGFDPSFFDFNVPEFDWWDFGGFDFGGGFDLGLPTDWWSLDPLALPSMPSYDSFFLMPEGGGQPDFAAFGVPPMEMQGLGGPPMTLTDLGFGGTGAPTVPMLESFRPGSDPMVNLMGETQPGLGYDPGWGMDMESMFAESPLPGGTPYGVPSQPLPGLGGPQATPFGIPSSPLPGLGGAGYTPPGTPATAATAASPSKWDVIAKLAAAFGPTALGAAGLGLQAANRPERNPLEDELLRAKITSTGLQDSLAKDRLAFEKANAAEMRAFQERMQAALLESRKPGGQANITALLQGNPQLASLYQALTAQGTGLASGPGAPEFQALIDQIAQVDIADLRRQADEQIAQANEAANRLGTNPANIIAKIEQTFLQEAAKARANARNILISQLRPGIDIFNSVGGLFGNLFQVPGA
jgi:hypothetical protein